MDNNFYDSKSRERKSVNSKKDKNKDIMTRIIIVQFVLSLAVTGTLYLVSKNDTVLSQNIKSFYCGIAEKDMSVSEIFDVFKNVAKSTFAPIDTEEDTEIVDEI